MPMARTTCSQRLEQSAEDQTENVRAIRGVTALVLASGPEPPCWRRGSLPFLACDLVAAMRRKRTSCKT